MKDTRAIVARRAHWLGIASLCCALVAPATGQENVIESYDQPLREAGSPYEYASTDGLVQLSIRGEGSGARISTWAQAFVFLPGSSVIVVGGIIQIDDGLGTHPVIDADLDGVFGDPFTTAIDGKIALDMTGIAPIQREQLWSNLLASAVIGGSNGAVGLQLEFRAASGGSLRTQNPTSFVDGEFNPEATSPQVLVGALPLVAAFYDESDATLRLRFDESLTNEDDGNPNNTDPILVSNLDLELDGNSNFGAAVVPSGLLAPPMITGERNEELLFRFDPSLPSAVLPRVGEYVRIGAGRVRDFTGRLAVGDDDGVRVLPRPGESPYARFVHPRDVDGNELVSATGIVELDYVGLSNGEPVRTSVRYYAVPGDGVSVPIAVGDERLIDDGTGSSMAVDTDDTFQFGDPLTDDHAGAVRVDMARAYENSPTLALIENSARLLAGEDGAVCVQYIFGTPSGDPVRTALPVSFNASGGGQFDEAAGSPRLLPGTLAIERAAYDEDTETLTLEFATPLLPLDPDNPNRGTSRFGVRPEGLSLDDTPAFSTPVLPSAFVAAPTIEGETQDMLVIRFDGSVSAPNLPEIGEYIRLTTDSVRDEYGRFAFADIDGALIEFGGCASDCFGDGVVNMDDLIRILLFLGQDPDYPCEVDGDGVITFNDLVVTLFNFGECP